jgi:hypothetical protein
MSDSTLPGYKVLDMNFINVSQISPGLTTRPRRRYHEVDRSKYICNWNGCQKAYGTISHLNMHVNLKKHGSKRLPSQFNKSSMNRKKRRVRHDEKEEDRLTYTGAAEQQEQRDYVIASGKQEVSSTTLDTQPHQALYEDNSSIVYDARASIIHESRYVNDLVFGEKEGGVATIPLFGQLYPGAGQHPFITNTQPTGSCESSLYNTSAHQQASVADSYTLSYREQPTPMSFAAPPQDDSSYPSPYGGEQHPLGLRDHYTFAEEQSIKDEVHHRHREQEAASAFLLGPTAYGFTAEDHTLM